MEGLCVSSVEVRGLLREPLLQGRPALAAAVSGLRQLATVIEREGALSFPAEGGAEWSLEVEESLAIAVRWRLSFELGGAERGRLAPRVALPGKLEGEVVLSLAADDARISKLWLRQLAVNGREVVDGRLSELLKSLSEGRGGGDIVRELIIRRLPRHLGQQMGTHPADHGLVHVVCGVCSCLYPSVRPVAMSKVAISHSALCASKVSMRVHLGESSSRQDPVPRRCEKFACSALATRWATESLQRMGTPPPRFHLYFRAILRR